jgi:hypothetical protein
MKFGRMTQTIMVIAVCFLIAGCSQAAAAPQSIETIEPTQAMPTAAPTETMFPIMQIPQDIPTIFPTIKRAETIESSTDRFTAQFWRYEGDITSFEISDRTTGVTYRQDLEDVEGLYIKEGAWSIDGGHSFHWTPSERYIVLLTSPRVHGCSYLLVYAGDGSKLIYFSKKTSACTDGHFSDEGITLKDLCANDDIFFVRGMYDYNLYRFRPSTLEEVFVKKLPPSEDHISQCEPDPVFETFRPLSDTWS